jgi:predicted dehydrogenase
VANNGGDIMPKLKFALLGCGRISVKHVEALINIRKTGKR